MEEVERRSPTRSAGGCGGPDWATIVKVASRSHSATRRDWRVNFGRRHSLARIETEAERGWRRGARDKVKLKRRESALGWRGHGEYGISQGQMACLVERAGSKRGTTLDKT